MNKKTVALLILKESKKYRKDKVRKRQEIYFNTFKEQDKLWADMAIDCSVEFIEVLEDIFGVYKKLCLKTVGSCSELFTQKQQLKKSKDYKTSEYLDSKYNHVVVPDIKDKLLELNKSFKNEIEKIYEKYINKGLISDAAGVVFKGMDMDFDFNRYDETTRDYLRDKKIKWANEVADTTERGIKTQLVKGYEDGDSSYDIAHNIESSSNFSFKRCEAIARTEIISSCNYVDYTAFMSNPDVVGVRWSSSGDKRVRPTHKAADGQTRRKVRKENQYELESPFIIGNSKLNYPGDNSLGAAAKEVVRCRCTLYPVFKGESIDSNTIYDDKDVGTTEWVLRQDELFQIDYVGGNAKKALFERQLITANDLDKPWRQIKKEINTKMVNNFAKLRSQGVFAGLNPFITNTIEEQLCSILDYGLNNNKENLCALGISKFTKGLKDSAKLKLFPNIIANKDNKKKENGKNDENLVLHFTDEHSNKLDNQPENSVILIHNHPDGITLSPEDLVMLLKYPSIKYIFAVGHNGEIFVIGNDKRKSYKFSEEEWQNHLKSMHKIQNINLKRVEINDHNDIENAIEYSIKSIAKHYNIYYYTSRR